MSEIEKAIEEPLKSLSMTIPFSCRDWATEKRDAWVWGIVCGWDDDCFPEFQRKFGWDKEIFERLKRLHTRFEALQEKQERENPQPLTLEQLKSMDGEPVFFTRCGWGIIGFRKVGTDEHGEYDKKYTVGFSYGWEWLDDVMRSGQAYAHKPEQEEK